MEYDTHCSHYTSGLTHAQHMLMLVTYNNYIMGGTSLRNVVKVSKVWTHLATYAVFCHSSV
jgi:hypothetical protein